MEPTWKAGIAPMKMTGNLYENWLFFKQRFTNYLKATDITSKAESVQCAQLLHLIGEDGFRIYNTFKIQETEKDKLQPLLKHFETHFKPRTNVAYERYKFFMRKQIKGESVDQFITDLQNRAKQCELGSLEDSLIKTCITCGVLNDKIRQRLLEEDEITLEAAIKITKSIECSIQQAETMTSVAESTSEVQAVNRSTTKKKHFQAKARMQNQKECGRCGGKHRFGSCPAKKAKCSFCSKLGHYSKLCWSSRIKNINIAESNEDLFIGSVSDESNPRDWKVQLKINNNIVSFKIDTGAMANVLCKKDFDRLGYKLAHLKKTNVKLSTYSNEYLPVLGKCNLHCKYKGKNYPIDFYIVNITSPPIIGLQTCETLNLIQRINLISNDNDNNNNVKSTINEYNDVFTGTVGCLGEPYKITLKKNAEPVVHPPRRIPHALKHKLKETLDDLERNGIIAKMDEPSDWVNSMVIVRKKSGNLRICIDPRDLNKVIKREYFQLPTLEEMTHNLSGNKFFSKLDASNGFWHIPLDEASSKLCVFQTPFSRYRFLRLPYGIKSASEVFHKRFKEIFDIPGVQVYIDDLIIYGSTQAQHDERLKTVLELARINNVKFNKEKCEFNVKEIKFLGFIFNENGQAVDNEKVRAIVNMKQPTNKKEVQKILGMVTYLSKHIKNMSLLTEPLRQLIKNNSVWQWTAREENAFKNIKQAISHACILKHFDITKQCTITVDCSKNAIGAALLQDGQPCAYTSKALTETQCSYAQIEKEMLGIVYACEKFHNYIYPSHFIVETDHKPLVAIIKKPILKCPPRLQRMLFKLSKYNFTLHYKKGSELYVADTLSRTCMDKPEKKDKLDLELEEQICLTNLNFNVTESKLNQLITETENDEILKRVKKYIKSNWPTDLSPDLRFYRKIKDEITESNGLLLKGTRIIVPSKMRNEMLNRIHYAHLGIEKCKNLARQYLYWPLMSDHIETLVKNCNTCAKYQNNVRQPLKPHNIPGHPWQIIGSDIFYLNSKYYLLVIDYYSKFIEIALLGNDCSSKNLINNFKSIFARHGIPEILKSDGGKQYDSEEFMEFARQWEFNLVNSSPEYPRSNGMSERYIQTLKKLMIKANENNQDLYLTLLMYRSTPIDSKLPSPAELLMSRKLRNKIPTTNKNLQPKITKSTYTKKLLKDRQTKQKSYYDRGTKKLKPLKNKEKVFVKRNNKIEEGEICEKIRDRTYKVKLKNDKFLNRNRTYLTPIPSYCENNKDPKILSKEALSETDQENTSQTSDDDDDYNLDQSFFNLPAQTSSGRQVRRPQRLNL